MAIARVVYPTMVIHGTIKEVKNNSGKGKNGDWALRSLIIEQASGAQFSIVAFADDKGQFPFGAPAVGEFFVANVFVRENAREPELQFHSWAFDALDQIHSALSSKKAA